MNKLKTMVACVALLPAMAMAATKLSCMSVSRWLAGGMTSPSVRVRPSFKARALAFGL